VRVNVLHGGTEGGEGRMRLALSSNSIQAAVFTSFGLSDIYPSILTMSAPFLIRNERELDEVMKELQPVLERRLNSGEYFMLAWSKAGFVNIYS
jgi:TRAP-type C4-dicarboxylate transport system substrate-binding protein